MEKLYIPTHDELIEMGFTPQEWEGKIYRYDFNALSWHPEKELPYEPSCWYLSSWYQQWHPRSRQDVEFLISRYNPIQ